MTEKSMLERVKSVRNNEQTQLLNCLVQQNEDLLEELRNLNEQKSKQLDNDKLFRAEWAVMKMKDRKFTILSILVAVFMLTNDIIKPREDFPVLAQRFEEFFKPLMALIGG